jgi:hypothetical protein
VRNQEEVVEQLKEVSAWQEDYHFCKRNTFAFADGVQRTLMWAIGLSDDKPIEDILRDEGGK